MDLSEYALDRVRADTDGNEPDRIEGALHSGAGTGELDRAWAVRPILLTRSDDRTTLVLEDPGGQPLDLLTKPADLGQFLRLQVPLKGAGSFPVPWRRQAPAGLTLEGRGK
jgi:hypothetical protein